MSENKSTSVTGTEVWFDSATGLEVVNDSAIPNDVIGNALEQQHPHLASLARMIASQVSNWNGQGSKRGATGLFERDRYVTPTKIAHQMRVASFAARHDDIVSGVVETTESIAFSRMSFESTDDNEENIWNQIAGDLDLDARLREMWRELFTISQFYCVTWWGNKEYRVKGKANVRESRKSYRLRVPVSMGLLDPLKVVPVGNFMFGRESLAYIADRDEAVDFDDVLAGKNSSDLVVMQLIQGKYQPSTSEQRLLQDQGFDTDNLYTLNPRYVWRHTLTRPQYERFADVRMVSTFELLDMKQQLRQMDRAHLIGGTNFIVLVKIGTDEMPGKPAEVAQLTGMVRTAARVPVIVGDHRLNVEIVTPRNDETLRPERYNTLDARITARLYNMFMLGNYQAGGRGDDSIKLARVVGRAMESRRHMLRRALEKHIIKPTFDANDSLKSEPRLRFHPKRISLDFDPAVATMLMDLRDRGDLSRQTILSELDFNQEDEARKREREAEMYDDIFQTAVPHSSPSAQPFDPSSDPRSGGRNGGGNRNGGGAPGGRKSAPTPKDGEE